MAREGIHVIETAVGDRYVLAAMLERQILMGGEQSGHIVFLDRHTTGDGILTALRLMSVMARRGMGLADLARDIPRFPQVMENVPVRDRNQLDTAKPVWEAVRVAERLLGTDGRVLVRASGTEQLVRVMAEASTEEAARDAVARIAASVRETL
jgi:phosphoglucosamine mutase